MDPPTAAERPTLVYVYHPRSFATMSLIEAARDRCSMIWVVDSSDLRLGSMPRLLARTGLVIDAAGKSPTDIAEMISPHRPDGILTLADDLLCWTAALASALGLPFHSPHTATLLTDKFAQRRALSAAGLTAPGSWVVGRQTPPEEWDQLLGALTFPAVLKPRFGEGSRDTMKVSSLDEARTAVADDEHLQKDRDWVLEEYIPDLDEPACGEGFANYVSVETIVHDDTVTHLAVTGRTPPAYPFRETGFFIPAAVTKSTAADVKLLAAQGSAALGITLGCLHTEIKITPLGPVIIEVNGRIGGGIPELLDLTMGIDFLGMAFDLAIGKTEVPQPTATRALAYLLYVQSPADMREVTFVDGLDAVRRERGVVEVTMNRGPGHAVHWRDGNHGHVLSVLGTVENAQSLRRVLARFDELIIIEGS